MHSAIHVLVILILIGRMKSREQKLKTYTHSFKRRCFTIDIKSWFPIQLFLKLCFIWRISSKRLLHSRTLGLNFYCCALKFCRIKPFTTFKSIYKQLPYFKSTICTLFIIRGPRKIYLVNNENKCRH